MFCSTVSTSAGHQFLVLPMYPTHLQILRKNPRRWAFRTMSPLSSRMAFVNWCNHIEESAGNSHSRDKVGLPRSGGQVHVWLRQILRSSYMFYCLCFHVVLHAPMASLLFAIASMFTRLPTGSSSCHKPLTPILLRCYPPCPLVTCLLLDQPHLPDIRQGGTTVLRVLRAIRWQVQERFDILIFCISIRLLIWTCKSYCYILIYALACNLVACWQPTVS